MYHGTLKYVQRDKVHQDNTKLIFNLQNKHPQLCEQVKSLTLGHKKTPTSR